MYSGPITIIERHGYKVDSYGNGAAYTLTKLSDGASAFFQGDDAESFRSDVDSAYAIEDEDRADRALEHILSAYDEVLTPA